MRVCELCWLGCPAGCSLARAQRAAAATGPCACRVKGSMEQHALVVHDMPIAQFRAKLKQLQDERHARVEAKRWREWLEEQDTHTRSNTKANAAKSVQH